MSLVLLGDTQSGEPVGGEANKIPEVGRTKESFNERGGSPCDGGGGK